jgi:hypothetical protein
VRCGGWSFSSAGAQARSRWSIPRLNNLDRAEHPVQCEVQASTMLADPTERAV